MSNISFVDLDSLDKASVVWFSPAISIATWFDGEAPIEHIHLRVKTIMTHNPWLMGRLKRNGNSTYIEYNVDTSSTDSRSSVLCVDSIEESVFAEDSNYSQVSNLVMKYCVQSGDNSCNRDISLFQVSVLLSNNQRRKRFILVISLCHTLGDARSLYQIMKMISAEEEVTALNPNRNKDILQHAIRKCGETQMNFLLNSPTLFIGNVLHLLFDNKSAAGVFEVDSEQIHLSKQSHTSDNVTSSTFVSTNDVLTSWLGNQFHSDFYVMSINMLHRYFDEHGGKDIQEHRDLFGNYTLQLLFQNGEYEEPAKIREAVDKLALRHVDGEGNENLVLPSILECLRLKGYLVLTNWSGVYEELYLPNCTMVRQIPIYPTNLLMHVAVIFRLNREGKLGLLLITYPKKLSKFENSCTTNCDQSCEPSDVNSSLLRTRIL